MLKKINCLNKDKEFDNVFKNGRVSYDKILGVRAASSKIKNCRFGIIVSNKISKKAVERNKIKRRLRDIAGKELEKLKGGFDVIMIALPTISEGEYQEMKLSVIGHFKKLRLYK
ncbi:MAG: ribonuclease P protein component [Patescibacteria group bacterium]